jgi:hypothetical protein
VSASVLVAWWAGSAAYACHGLERVERDFACELAGFVLSDVDGLEFIRFFLLAK